MNKDKQKQTKTIKQIQCNLLTDGCDDGCLDGFIVGRVEGCDEGCFVG